MDTLEVIIISNKPKPKKILLEIEATDLDLARGEINKLIVKEPYKKTSITGFQ
jgi:hypothetical protein